MSKDAFKLFAQKHPNLASFVNSGQMTWQKFYEMYDLYGDSSEVWNSYLSTSSKSQSVSKINNLIKNVDMDSIKEHINTAQKALDFVQELTNKTSPITKSSSLVPRPMNKFFED